MSKTKLFSNLILLAGAFIWGFAFVAQSVSMDYIGPLTFNFARFGLATFVLCLYLLLTKSTIFKDVKEKNQRGKDSIVGGVKCGIALFIASTFQQIGLQYTAASKAGFITALYLILVPIVGIFLGKKISKKLWLGVIIAVIGMYLLCIKEDFSIEFGDILEFLCALSFAFQIMFVDDYCNKSDPVFLCMMQTFVAAILSLVCSFFFEEFNLAGLKAAWFPIFYAGALSGGLAYTFQIIGQKGTDPTSGSLIMSLESVFAAIGGFVILHEVMSVKELIGCVLMFTAIIITQLPDRKSDYEQ